MTVTFSQAAVFVDVRILEYSGLDTANPLDKTAGAAGSGTTASSGAVTTTAANELIFGAGMTLRNLPAPEGIHFADHHQPGRGHRGRPHGHGDGKHSATAPNSSSNWVMQVLLSSRPLRLKMPFGSLLAEAIVLQRSPAAPCASFHNLKTDASPQPGDSIGEGLIPLAQAE